MTSFIDGVVEFYVWPMDIDAKSMDRLQSCDVQVYNRNLPVLSDKSLDQHQYILEHVNRASDLADIISSTIEAVCIKYDKDIEDVVIANEGFAFSAKGDAALQLAGYKYILMNTLIENGFKIFKTYSPITIKKTAGCSKRGLGKDAMIDALSNEPVDNHLIQILHDDPEYLKKKTNYVLCMDDIADSYWCYKTCLNDINGKR